MTNKRTVIPCVVNQNFYGCDFSVQMEKKVGGKKSRKIDLNELQSIPDITRKSLESDYKKIQIMSFCRKDRDVEDSLVLGVRRKKNAEGNDCCCIQTGLYAGVIYTKDFEFRIGTGYGDAFLRRMLRCANGIFVQDSGGCAEREDSSAGFPLFEYLFILSLQKACLLGFPQEYAKRECRSLGVHGNIDLPRYVSRDIPFRGKISCCKNERRIVQPIADVLYTALKASRKEIRDLGLSRISSIMSELSSDASRNRLTVRTIEQAKRHKSLENPIFSPFRRTLEYAELVLRKKGIIESEYAKAEISGYLLDVSSLWESYLAGLLRNGLPDWQILEQEELNLYPGAFYGRKNYPDFVLKRDVEGVKECAVFDAKFKKMEFKGKDVDRMDLFQIHSYAGYFRLHCGYGKLKACGLLYPLSKNQNSEKDVVAKGNVEALPLYGISGAEEKFFIDGVYVGEKTQPGKNSERPTPGDLENAEMEFVNRMAKIVK